MNNALLVGVFESLRDLLRNRQGFLERQGARSYPLGQSLTFYQFHHQSPGAGRLFEAMYGSNIRMVQQCENLCFPLEPPHALSIVGNVLG